MEENEIFEQFETEAQEHLELVKEFEENIEVVQEEIREEQKKEILLIIEEEI